MLHNSKLKKNKLGNWVVLLFSREVVSDSVTPVDCSTPGSSVLHCLPEFAQIHVRWVGDAVCPSHPVTPCSFCLQSFPASGSFPVSWLFPSGGQSTRASASASVLPVHIRSWSPLVLTDVISLMLKDFSISPSSEYSELISFSADWCDLLAVQGPVRSLFHHHRLKASFFPCSAFFIQSTGLVLF